jgi:pyruvate dehydrogenase E2 component (dihydrolipoamide acetyltransferase)
LSAENNNVIGLTRIQKLIGKRMHEAKLNKPSFYLNVKVDITNMMELRQKLRKSHNTKVTTNSFYIKALANAAEKFPLMIGRIQGENIVIENSVNVGFAVDAPQGLVVPVIKDANTKSLIEICREESEFTEKARDNKLTPSDMDGQNICTTNLGAFNIDSFIAIIPPISSAILAIGKSNREMIAQNKQPVAKKILTMTLTVDHKVINGDYAARFLRCVVQQLENPGEMA